MCYDLISTATFFNVLGMLTWFYFCWKAGVFGANVIYPVVCAKVKELKKFFTKG